MTDVYIAGSLRHTPKEWWKIYEKLADVAKKFGLNVHVPHIDTVDAANMSSEDIHNPNLDLSVRAKVYNKNLEVIKNSKLIIAEVSNPSIGTGIELGVALQHNKPIICLAKTGADITSMVLGPVNLGMIEMVRYENESEALNKLENVLTKKFSNLINK